MSCFGKIGRHSLSSALFRASEEPERKHYVDKMWCSFLAKGGGGGRGGDGPAGVFVSEEYREELYIFKFHNNLLLV